MNKIIKDSIDYAIQRNYKFIYRKPCEDNSSDYIDMMVTAKEVNIDNIWNRVKDHLEDNQNRVITLIFKR